MKTFPRRLLLYAILLAIVLAAPRPARATDPFPRHNKNRSNLAITRDPETGKVLVSWSGHGVLRQGRGLGGHWHAVGGGGSGHNGYVAEPTDTQALFTLEPPGSPVFAGNIVGYVNLTLPPGLSLIANPLSYTNNSLAFWLPDAPDGAQVYKYGASGGYEVSTYDGASATWSNPDLQVPVGDGFYFNNPSSESRTYLFVGEVPLGVSINPLPAGISTKGALIPQAGSISSIQGIPGEPGDVLRIYINHVDEGGAYSTSVFDGTTGAWVPDLSLDVGQGFWLQKQHAQDWIRIFTIN